MGCGAPDSPDPRHADVVVESPGLAAPTMQAATWWYSASGTEVEFNIVDRCAEGWVCVRVFLGDVPPDDGGTMTYPAGHPDDCTVRVSTAIPEARWPLVMGHELGHVMGLPHSSGIMAPWEEYITWELPAGWR